MEFLISDQSRQSRGTVENFDFTVSVARVKVEKSGFAFAVGLDNRKLPLDNDYQVFDSFLFDDDAGA